MGPLREKLAPNTRNRDVRHDVDDGHVDRDQREPPRWQRNVSNEGYRGGSQRDYTQQGGVRGGPPPGPYGRGDEEEHWKDKRSPTEEVQIALDRARIREEEEEKRYEEKKRMERTKLTGKKSRDFSDEHEREEPVDSSVGRSRGNSESRDDKIPLRGESNRDYRQYPDRDRRDNFRDNYRDYGRDQYDQRSYDRRDGPREQQPVFSPHFKSKLPPRFQKQQQQHQHQHQEEIRRSGVN